MSANVEGSKRLDLRPRPNKRITQYALGEHADDIEPELRSNADAPPESPRKIDPPRVVDADPQADPDPEPAPHDHPLLIDAHEDRWRWRRKIRENPRKLFFYRICVALLGVLLLCLAAITGPLPGPGGIPIALLGIAVWSSEFEWAQRLMLWFKSLITRYQALPKSSRVVLMCLAVLGALTGVYVALLRFGVPGWLPDFLENALRHLPGL